MIDLAIIWARLVTVGLALMMISVPVKSSSPPQWTYSDQTESGGWAGLTEEGSVPPANYPYAVCSIGKQQSPIPLFSRSPKARLNPIRIAWPPFHADFFNNGYVLEVLPGEAIRYQGFLSIGRDVYPFVQVHLHSPSEHTLDGRTYAAELHFVHARANGMVALLTVFLEIGEPNPELQMMLDHEANTPGVPTHRPSSIRFDPKGLLPYQAITSKGILVSRYLSYQGSLSEPPCTEGVAWYALEKPTTLSSQQLEQMQLFFKNNRRTLQPANGREAFSNHR